MNTIPVNLSKPKAETKTSRRRSLLWLRVPWIPLISLLALINISFLAGAIVMLLDWPPGPSLRKGLAGAQAWMERFWPSAKAKEHALVAPPNENRPLVAVDVPAATCDGFTLFTTVVGHGAQLIDMRGKVVHEWSLAFRKAWPKTPHITLPAEDAEVHWFRTYLYPNGDLLAVYHAENDTPYGYGLAKMDKQSRPLWTYSAPAHHDVDVGEDGTIYALTQDITETERDDPLKSLHPSSYLADSLVLLSPDGKEKKKIMLADALAASPYGLMLYNPESIMPSKGDFLHANCVKVLKSDRAGRFPLFRAGQVLVSLRNQDLIVVVDPEKDAVVWAARGPWHQQHDAEFLDNGRLLVFDNMGAFWNRGQFTPEDRRSRIVEFDPVTQAASLTYSGSSKSPFFSRLRGMKQRLPNGNTLITDPDHGTLFEVTPTQRIVWRFLGPCHPDGAHIAFITGARRYRESELPFLKGIAHARP